MVVWAVSLLTMELSSHSLTPVLILQYSEFSRIIRVKPKIILLVLYPRKIIINEASPKAISGRTSYYQARLAFYSLPQLIPEYCTAHGFGPPLFFRRNSPWPWQARLASGTQHTA